MREREKRKRGFGWGVFGLEEWEDDERRGRQRKGKRDSGGKLQAKKIFFFWSLRPSILLLERERAETEVYKVPFWEMAVMKKEPESTFW